MDKTSGDPTPKISHPIHLGRVITGASVAALPMLATLMAAPYFKELLPQIHQQAKMAALGALIFSTPSVGAYLIATSDQTSLLIDSQKPVRVEDATSAVFHNDCPATTCAKEYEKIANRYSQIVIQAKQDPRGNIPRTMDKNALKYHLDAQFVCDFHRSRFYIGKDYFTLLPQKTLFSSTPAAPKESLPEKAKEFVALLSALIPADVRTPINNEGATPLWVTQASTYLNQKLTTVGLEMVTAYYQHVERNIIPVEVKESQTYFVNYAQDGFVYAVEMQYHLLETIPTPQGSVIKTLGVVNSKVIYCPQTNQLTVNFSSPKWL